MISGQAKSITIDENGNLKVATEYTLTDGSKQTGHTRYNCFNFSKDMLLKDIQSQCENLMRKTYNLKQNVELAKVDVSDVSFECSSVEFVTKPEIKDEKGVITQAKESIIIDDK
jgi:hypothetical protein